MELFMNSWIRKNRFLIGRRLVQVGIVLLFFSSARFDWKPHGVRILQGNLSASTLFEFIPMADPFAVLQILLTGQDVLVDVLIGAVVIVVFYIVVGGRVFCSWVCPVNLVADTAQKARAWLKLPSFLRISRWTRYVVMVLTLVLSAFSGVAAFEWISPISMFHRELFFGMKAGWAAVFAIFLCDLFVRKQTWCGHLCPLGAFYSVLGRTSFLRIRFEKQKCTKCGDCHRICPEPHVLNLNLIFREEMVYSGNCTNCGRCVTHCPENCFRFSFRKMKRPEAALLNR